jgi:hypothetical protein
VVFGIMLFTMLLVAAMMAKMEGRSFGDYGLPLRRVLCFQFWQGYGVGFLSLAALLAFMRLVGVFSFGPRLLHGAEAWKYGFGWTVSMMLACVLEEYFYRGYLQYTLTGGIGFCTCTAIIQSGHGSDYSTCFFLGWSHAFCCAEQGISGCLPVSTRHGIGARYIFSACLAADRQRGAHCSEEPFTGRAGLPVRLLDLKPAGPTLRCC